MTRDRGFRTALGVAVVVVLATGCTSDDEPVVKPAASSETRTASADPTATAAAAGTVLPNGKWSKIATLAQLRKLGVTRKGMRELGRDGELPVLLQVIGDFWSITVTDDSGATDVGDLGSLTYEDDDRVVMTSDSEGCPGCVLTVTWSLEGDRLTLVMTPDTTATPLERLVLEGVFRTVS